MWSRTEPSGAPSRPPTPASPSPTRRATGFPLTFVNEAFLALTGYTRATRSSAATAASSRARRTDPGARSPRSRPPCASSARPPSCSRTTARTAAVLQRAAPRARVRRRRDATPRSSGSRTTSRRSCAAQRSLQRATRVIAEQDQELAELRVLQRALTPVGAAGAPAPGARELLPRRRGRRGRRLLPRGRRGRATPPCSSSAT